MANERTISLLCNRLNLSHRLNEAYKWGAETSGNIKIGNFIKKVIVHPSDATALKVVKYIVMVLFIFPMLAFSLLCGAVTAGYKAIFKAPLPFQRGNSAAEPGGARSNPSGSSSSSVPDRSSSSSGSSSGPSQSSSSSSYRRAPYDARRKLLDLDESDAKSFAPVSTSASAPGATSVPSPTPHPHFQQTYFSNEQLRERPEQSSLEEPPNAPDVSRSSVPVSTFLPKIESPRASSPSIPSSSSPPLPPLPVSSIPALPSDPLPPLPSQISAEPSIGESPRILKGKTAANFVRALANALVGDIMYYWSKKGLIKENQISLETLGIEATQEGLRILQMNNIFNPNVTVEDLGQIYVDAFNKIFGKEASGLVSERLSKAVIFWFQKGVIQVLPEDGTNPYPEAFSKATMLISPYITVSTPQPAVSYHSVYDLSRTDDFPEPSPAPLVRTLASVSPHRPPSPTDAFPEPSPAPLVRTLVSALEDPAIVNTTSAHLVVRLAEAFIAEQNKYTELAAQGVHPLDANSESIAAAMNILNFAPGINQLQAKLAYIIASDQLRNSNLLAIRDDLRIIVANMISSGLIQMLIPQADNPRPYAVAIEDAVNKLMTANAIPPSPPLVPPSPSSPPNLLNTLYTQTSPLSLSSPNVNKDPSTFAFDTSSVTARAVAPTVFSGQEDASLLTSFVAAFITDREITFANTDAHGSIAANELGTEIAMKRLAADAIHADSTQMLQNAYNQAVYNYGELWKANSGLPVRERVQFCLISALNKFKEAGAKAPQNVSISVSQNDPFPEALNQAVAHFLVPAASPMLPPNAAPDSATDAFPAATSPRTLSQTGINFSATSIPTPDLPPSNPTSFSNLDLLREHDPDAEPASTWDPTSVAYTVAENPETAPELGGAEDAALLTALTLAYKADIERTRKGASGKEGTAAALEILGAAGVQVSPTTSLEEVYNFLYERTGVVFNHANQIDDHAEKDITACLCQILREFKTYGAKIQPDRLTPTSPDEDPFQKALDGAIVIYKELVPDQNNEDQASSSSLSPPSSPPLPVNQKEEEDTSPSPTHLATTPRRADPKAAPMRTSPPNSAFASAGSPSISSSSFQSNRTPPPEPPTPLSQRVPAAAPAVAHPAPAVASAAPTSVVTADNLGSSPEHGSLLLALANANKRDEEVSRASKRLVSDETAEDLGVTEAVAELQKVIIYDGDEDAWRKLYCDAFTAGSEILQSIDIRATTEARIKTVTAYFINHGVSMKDSSNPPLFPEALQMAVDILIAATKRPGKTALLRVKTDDDKGDVETPDGVKGRGRPSRKAHDKVLISTIGRGGPVVTHAVSAASGTGKSSRKTTTTAMRGKGGKGRGG